MKQTYGMVLSQTQNEIAKFGYTLSEADIRQLIITQKLAYEAVNMIDMDHHILYDLATVFAHSPYLLPASYVSVIKEGLFAYYVVRSQVHHRYDDELVALLYEVYMQYHGEFSKACIWACIQRGRAE